MGAWLSIDVLGPFRARLNGEPVLVPRGRRRVLLAGLALSPGRLMTVQTLAEWMWPDGLPLHPGKAVQNNVRHLRSLLGADWVGTAPGGYVLNVEPDDVDAARFVRLVEASAKSRARAERTGLSEALALWRGELLSGVDSDALVDEHLPALTERRLTASERLVDLELAEQRYAEAIPRLHDLTNQHPLRESLWQRLITALSRSGRQAEALEAYERVRILLADELGTDPSAELRTIHHALLTGDGPRASTEIQSSNEDARPSAVPQQLPPDTRDFTGRSRELAELDRLLDDTQVGALGVIHGVGGAGKSALAVHWGHRVRERFPDGQLSVNLGDRHPQRRLDSFVALGEVLRSLGYDADLIPHSIDERAALLRSGTADRQILLLIENAIDVSQVRPLLLGPGSAVLVTSRRTLAGLSIRNGARSLAIEGLSAEEATQLLTTRIGSKSVVDDQTSMADLVALTGLLPLAIQLAADLFRSYRHGRLGDVVADLRSRGGLDGLRIQSDPSSNLSDIFSWSYAQLAPLEARLFCSLGLQPGGSIPLTAAAVGADTGESDARQALERLADLHLIEPREPGWYTIHALLHEYAMAQAHQTYSGKEVSAIRQRLLDWYVIGAATARSLLASGSGNFQPTSTSFSVGGGSGFAFASRSEAVDWLDRHVKVLVSAVELAYREHLDMHCWQLARVLRTYFSESHEFDYWIMTCSFGYKSAQRIGDPSITHQAAHALASAYRSQYQLDKAIELYHVALENASAVDDPTGISKAYGGLAIASAQTNDYETSLDLHHHAVLAAERSPEPTRLPSALNNLGRCACEAGNYDVAITTLVRAMDLARSIDDKYVAELARANLGYAHLRAGRLVDAQAQTEQALAFFAAGQYTIAAADTRATLGLTLLARDDPRAAQPFLQEALKTLHDHPFGLEASSALQQCRSLLAERSDSPD